MKGESLREVLVHIWCITLLTQHNSVKLNKNKCTDILRYCISVATNGHKTLPTV